MFLKTLSEDVRVVRDKDPAARSTWEIFFCYPGLHAVWCYRLAHWLWYRHLYFSARFLSHLARMTTGVEIHPGARIGKRFFIDHGSGVVIGETAEIGDDVLMYQGSVLGGTSLKKEKRHPTVGDRVVIGSGAIVLGAINIGSDARVGSGSVVVHPVPAGTTVVGVPAHVVWNGQPPAGQLEHNRLNDPLAMTMQNILVELNSIRGRLNKLEETVVPSNMNTIGSKLSH